MRTDGQRQYGMLRATVEHKFGSLGARDLDPVFAIAERVHRDERRRSGEPYITHPITVAQYVADWGLPLICIQAALAHDIPQSGQLDACAEQLGQELSACIREVHALGTPGHELAEVADGGAAARNVLSIKVADRLHNARTWQYVPRAKAQDRARDTLAQVAPAAAALRLLDVAAELRDLSRAVLAQPQPDPRLPVPRMLGHALRVLPAPERQRYRDEWTADLAQLDSRRERRAMSWGLLYSAWMIRRQRR